MTPEKSFLIRYWPQLTLTAVWVIMQAVLLYTHGIVTVNEAGKYIEQADLLLDTGSVSHPSLWLYSTQILLIAAAKQLHTGYLSVVLVQLLFNALATWCLYKLCLQLSNRITAFACILLFILNQPFQSFNTYLYTESLFYSFTILLSCYLLRLTKLTVQNFIVLVLFLLLICFTRPSGLLFVPCTFLYLFFRFFQRLPFIVKTGLTLIVAVIFVCILNAVLGSGGELDFMLPFREEHIICGVPALQDASIGQTPEEANSIRGIINYIFQHPGQFFRLAWLRTQAFFGLFRSYYSFTHNLYLGFYFFPVYLLVILCLKNWWHNNRSLLLYCISIIIVTWGTVILTCDDWHNRFFLVIVPYIYILAIPALKKLTAKLQTDDSKPNLRS